MDALLAPRFELPPQPPFVPGASPFRSAGVVYQSAIAFIESAVPGGLGRVLQEIGPPELRRFFEQRFGVASFYDLLPIPYLAAAASRARHVSFVQHIQDSNRFAAHSRFADLYGALLRRIDSERLALSLPRAVKTLQSFGACTTTSAEPGRVRGVRTGVPEMLVRWYVLSTTAFLTQAIERASGSPVVIRFLEPEPDGSVGPQRTYRLPFEILFSAQAR